jgi:hypothetical protein
MIKVDVIPAIVSMNAALLANPFVALIAIVTAASVAFYAYSESIDRTAKSTAIIINFSNKATEAIAKQVEEIKKRNAELGLTLTALQKGITVDQATLNIEKNKLKAYEKTFEQLKAQNAEREKSIEYMGTEWLQNRNNLGIYQNKVEAQRELVAEMEKTAKTQSKINTLSAPKGEKLKDSVLTIDARMKTADANKMASVINRFSANVARLVKPIPMENLLQPPSATAWQNFAMKFGEGIDKVSGILVQGAAMIGASFTNALGASFVTGELDMKGIYQMFADLANAIAIQMIAIGTPLLFAGATAPLGLQYIAAGAALGIVAGAASAAASGSGGGGSSPAPTITEPRGMSTYFGNDSRAGSGTFSDRVYGRDLLLVIDGQGRVKRR